MRKGNGNLNERKTRKLDDAQSVEAWSPRNSFSRQDGGHTVAASRTGGVDMGRGDRGKWGWSTENFPTFSDLPSKNT